MTLAAQVRDFVPVEKVARQLLAACLEVVEPCQPAIKNLGTGHPQTLRQFAEFWRLHWNAGGILKFGAKPYRDGEVMQYVARIQNRMSANTGN